MIKNGLFVCCVALAGSLLCIGNIKGSATDIPEPLVGLTAEYAPEPRVIEASKKTYPNRVPCWYNCCSLREYRRMRDFNPEDFSFSHITSADSSAICVNNVYNPQAADGLPDRFTHIFSPANGLAAWHTEPDYLNGVVLEHRRGEQNQHTQKSRDIFRSALVPDGSSASFFPERNMLVVADATTVTTYNTTDQVYDAIDQALNPPRAPRRSRCCTIKALLSSGILVAGAATAYAAGQQLGSN